MFIAFEGIDGAGKTTAVRRLAEELRSRGYATFETREPTELFEPLISTVVRDGADPVSLFLLFTADRQMHQTLIQEKINSGDVVISDRYILSSYAYQGPGIELRTGSWDLARAWMDGVSRFINLRPDITILLDLDPQISVDRLTSRKASTIRFFERREYLTRVRETYLKMVDDRTTVIDSSKNKDAVFEDILQSLGNFLS